MKILSRSICFMLLIFLFIPLLSTEAALPNPNTKSTTLLPSYSSSMSDASIGQGFQSVLSNYPQLKLNITLDAGTGNKISQIEFLRYGSPISTSIVVNNAQIQTISTVFDGEAKAVVSGQSGIENTTGASYFSWYRYSNSVYWFADIKGVQNSSKQGSECGPSLTCLGSPGEYDNINGTNFWKYPNVSSDELILVAAKEQAYVLEDSLSDPTPTIIQDQFVSNNTSNFSATAIVDVGKPNIPGGFGNYGSAVSVTGTPTVTMPDKAHFAVKFSKTFKPESSSKGNFSAPGAAWMDWFFAFKTTLHSKTFVYPDQIRVTYALVGGTPTPTATPTGQTPAPTPVPTPNATVIGLTLDPTSLVMPVGGTSSFTATANYSDGSKKDVTNSSEWTIASPTIASVSSGYVIGKSVGTTQVTATFSGMSASGNVKVVAVPTAVLAVPSEVVTGDDFVGSGLGSFSPNGAIVKCIFMTSTANYNTTNSPPPGGFIEIPSCVTSFWYPLSLQNTTQTMRLIAVDVIDQGSYDTQSIKIVPPYIKANVSVGGALKVNRKIIIDPTVSYSPSHYPINSAILSVSPVTAGIAVSDIKYDPTNIMDGQHKINILVKKAGQYSTTILITNSLGQSDTKTVTFTVVPDLAPIADFWVDKTIYRDPANSNRAKIKINDLSYSPDSDSISKRIWYLYYDSNNDGSFTGESQILLDFANNKTYLEYDTANVGNYKVELEVTEGFGQPTLLQYIIPSDYLISNTWQ